MAGLPPWLANKGGSNSAPGGGRSGDAPDGKVPPQFGRGKNSGKNSGGRQAAIGRRLAAMKK